MFGRKRDTYDDIPTGELQRMHDRYVRLGLPESAAAVKAVLTLREAVCAGS